jgi:hypothetical protein
MTLHPALKNLIKEHIERLNSETTAPISSFEKETGLRVIGVSLLRLPSKDPKNQLLVHTQFKVVF